MPLAIEISQLTKRYANGVEALKGIDLKVEAGDFFALLGPNGAGKSTAIGILCSLINKTSGTVKILGHDLDNERIAAKKLIGLVPQEFNFNVFENVIDIVLNQAGFYGLTRPHALEKANHLLQKLGLWDKRNQPARTLSGGMKRRLMIARGLIHSPKILILDEPTAGVDLELRRSMWDFLVEINASGTTIILTTHYLEEAEMLCRNLAIINNGTIVSQGEITTLLSLLDTQTLILELTGPIKALPNIEGVTLHSIDSLNLEVTFSTHHTINVIFEKLSQYDIYVKNFRHKSNRLETLFLNFTQSREQHVV